MGRAGANARERGRLVDGLVVTIESVFLQHFSKEEIIKEIAGFWAKKRCAKMHTNTKTTTTKVYHRTRKGANK